MKSVFFLAALVAPLIALAEPGDSALGEVVRRQPGPNLLARSGIATSSISKECQSQCSPVITTLDVCAAFSPSLADPYHGSIVVHLFGTVGLQERCFLRMHPSEL
jgi:hypothetical protein